MGWWDTGVLGGDRPLDIIIGIEDALGVEDLYPLEAVAERGDRDAIVAALNTVGLGALCDRIDPQDPIVAQVVAAVAMAAGAPLGTFAQRAKSAALGDEWANSTEEASAGERETSMGALINTIDTYDGTPTVVRSPGLFEKIMG